MKNYLAIAIIFVVSLSQVNFASANTTSVYEETPIVNTDLQVAVYKRSNGVINIAIENKENQITVNNIKIRLIDARGKVLHTERTTATDQFSKNYDISHLEKGIYFVEITSNAQTLVKKIVVS